jgi:hypothetical protein
VSKRNGGGGKDDENCQKTSLKRSPRLASVHPRMELFMWSGGNFNLGNHLRRNDEQEIKSKFLFSLG